MSLIVSGLIPPATATLEFLMTDLTVRKLSNGDCPSLVNHNQYEHDIISAHFI